MRRLSPIFALYLFGVVGCGRTVPECVPPPGDPFACLEINGCNGAVDAQGVCQPVITQCEGSFDATGVCRGTRCGPGTHEENGLCVATGPTEGQTCGAGTVEVDGACVPDGTQCGTGTHLELGRCVANVDDVPLTCGPGTREQDGKCVADCGTGTKLSGTTCVAVGSLTCGAGTVAQDGVCVPNVSCGPGTILSGAQCVPTTGAWYDIRLGAFNVPADGYTKIPFLALGRKPDGTAATDEVIISLSRSSAGSVAPSNVKLSALGAMGYLTPCNTATSSTCAGTARLQLALASNPTQIVAQSEDFVLVAPTGVGSMAPCSGYQKALFFNGSGYIYSGTQTVSQGSFVIQSPAPGTTSATDLVYIRVEPSNSAQGMWWYLDFSTRKMGQMLNEQVYTNAERYPFEPAGQPGLSVTGDGRGCNQSIGSFQIHKLVFTNNTLTHFEATFEQFCEKNPSNWLRGCIRIAP